MHKFVFPVVAKTFSKKKSIDIQVNTLIEKCLGMLRQND